MKKSKFYFFDKNASETLEKLLKENFEIEPLKKSSSHVVFILKNQKENKPSFLLKAFSSKFFTINKVKKYLKKLLKLGSLGIPFIKPIFLFWENPQIAFLKRVPFYGGILFPYIEKGFIKKEDFFLDAKKEKVNYELIKALISFLFKLHEKGIYLRDTKYNNFYLSSEENFRIFDLDGVKIYDRSLSKFERLKDISTLAMALEWIKVENARKLIFNLYKELFPEIREEDFKKFNHFVDIRRKKREIKILKTLRKN